MMTKILRHGLSGLLAAFFVLGGTLNIFASPEVLADYETWGYPSWFHFITGGLELISAVMLAIPATRLAGSGLAALVMIGAAGTVLLHGDVGHAMAPLIVLAFLALNAWLHRYATTPRPVGKP